ncbi:hypothetical protein QUA08_32170, partial [Microcoleus sp. T3B2]|uniref:hypothetical protein n=1 Tax=Microcoleus sp. T3B2 TaxID=3055426 RepID=UPI002FD6BA61
PSFLDGRDAHPTITIKIVSYLIRDPIFTYLYKQALICTDFFAVLVFINNEYHNCGMFKK